MRGFLVKIIEGGAEKNLKINSPVLTIGSDYKSSIYSHSLKKSLNIAENKEGYLKINLIDGLNLKIHHNNRILDIGEIKDIFANKRYLELSKNIVCEISLDEKRIFFKASEFKEEKSDSINKFRKSYITRENIPFLSLFLSLSVLLLTFFIYATLNIKPLEKVAKFDEKDKEIEIDYKKLEKDLPDKKDEKTREGETKEKITEKRGERLIQTAKEPFKQSGGTFFEGQAVVKEGVLGVREGAKTVVIQKEKSLFSKIDETLDALPVKGTGETSERAKKLDGEDTEKYESVKAESIYKGPEKKEVKVELSAGASIKANVQKESEIRILKGKRPENEILSVMARYKKGFEFIFTDARKKDPQLEGKVVVFFVISEEGVVTKAEIVESTIKNQDFTDRILSLVKSIKFPPKSETGDTGVKIPFLFFPQG
ncbi:MAG: TonB family protein [Proteobacteria bacterium]|nr:TonB family protein [Pseudomonadota bacterium]